MKVLETARILNTPNASPTTVNFMQTNISMNDPIVAEFVDRMLRLPDAIREEIDYEKED